MTSETTDDKFTVLTIYTGADGFGCPLKEAILSHLKTLSNLHVIDLGVDAYYNVASKVGRHVSTSKTTARGLLFCGTGVGVAIFANKHPGVYAATCSSVDDALNARSINNCNVLCLSGMNTAVGDAIKIVDAWLNTEFKAPCPASGNKDWDDDLKEFLDNSVPEMKKIPYESSNCAICCVRKDLQFEKEKFMEAKEQMLEGSGRDQLTTDEDDAIFDSVTDPTSRSRRYGYGCQSTKPSNKATASNDIMELRAMIAQLQEQDRARAVEVTQLSQRLADYEQQHGRFPSSGGSGADDES